MGGKKKRRVPSAALERSSVRFVSLRQLPALGQCLATLAGAIPVAFLEPRLNPYNPCSVFSTKNARERAGEAFVITKVQQQATNIVMCNFKMSVFYESTA